MKYIRITLALFLFSVWGMGSDFAAETNLKSQALNRLNSEYPGLKIYSGNDHLSRLYGKPFGYSSSPETTADRFVRDYAAIYGIISTNLRPISLLYDGRHTQPVMYDRKTGKYKFTLVYYTQYSGNIPVFRCELRLLVLNRADNPLVLAASSLRDLGGFEAPVNTSINENLARTAAKSFNAELVNISEPRLVIWAGLEGEPAKRPRVAMEIVADNGLTATEEYSKWRFLVDSESGEILYSENMILAVDVTGSVNGMATILNAADTCNPETAIPLRYARVELRTGEIAFTDSNGIFIIPYSGSDDVIAISRISGQWFSVFNQGGPDAMLVDTIPPPGPVNFVHNVSDTSEFYRAQVNAYVQANVVRDFTLNYNPSYPGLEQNEFPVNVNINNFCDAYYDFNSINFYASGMGCANAAFSTVVYHEYGHHLVAMAGGQQGQYGEGQSDVMGVLITDDPVFGLGFQFNCDEGIRSAVNTIQYPCGDEQHYCGQLLSGCVWDAMQALEVNYPDYRDIMANLSINAILLHTSAFISPEITIDYLTLDDDNGDIYDGTPHYNELCEGFSAHNMDCPELHLVEFLYPNGQPDYIDPAGGTTVDVEVAPLIQMPVSNSGVLHYNDGSGWDSVDMQETSPNVYQAIFPEVTCAVHVLYYFSVQTDEGETVTDPLDAPETTYARYSVSGLTTMMEDNFEGDNGWIVINSGGLGGGAWERAIPIDTSICNRGNPPSDYDGSGYCYVTDNDDQNDCDSDVDDGSTSLISPTLPDLTGFSVLINYALWYTNNTGENPNIDIFHVYVSSDNGTTWIDAVEYGPITQAGWNEEKFLLNDFIVPNNQVRINFEASDIPGRGSTVEAGIDAFRVDRIECVPTSIPEGAESGNLPVDFTLIGAYPNPFNAQVAIEYALPRTSHVTLEIFDLLGRKIETLVDESQSAGYKSAVWDAENNSTGMYFYRIRMGNFSDTGKMTLLK